MTINARCNWADNETMIWEDTCDLGGETAPAVENDTNKVTGDEWVAKRPPDTSIYSHCADYNTTANTEYAPIPNDPDPFGLHSDHKAKKYDAGKPDVSLVHPDLILGVAEVLTFGANKYGRKNYLESKGDPVYAERLYSAMQRHLLAYAAGERLDPESGLPHLYHMTAGVAMLTDLDEVK